MWFLLLKLLKNGYSSYKDHKNPTSPDATTPARNPRKTLLECLLRFFQFVFGLAVIGLYAQDIHIHTYSTASNAAPAKWVYAVVTAFLATLSALIYLLLPFILKSKPLHTRRSTHLPLFIWESVFCILWLTLFGIFGKLYIGDYGDDKVKRMRHAVWVDLVNLGLWVGTGFWAGMRWWRGDKSVEEGQGGEKDGEKEGV